MTDAGRAPSLLRRNPLRGRFLRDGDPATEPASILCLPNVISIVRILCIPALLWLIIADAIVWVQPAIGCALGAECELPAPAPNLGEAQYGPLRWAAAIVFIVAIATDALDGHLARSRRLVTDLGIFLDPVADKGLTGAALIGIALVEPTPWFWWPAVILVLVREWGITWWRAVALKDRVIPAGPLGKLKTAIQGVAISFILLPWPLLSPAFHVVNIVLMVVVVAITLWSGLDYLVKAYRPARSANA